MNNRDKVISRVQKELIGPGSDLFDCSDKINFLDEIIASKPLLRYYSGILYPKQISVNDNVLEYDDQGEGIPIELAEDNNSVADEDNSVKGENDIKQEEENKEIQYSASTFFPSKYGVSFVVSKDCPEIKVTISFGNYKKVKPENIKDIALPYNGDSINLLEEFSLQEFVEYDDKNKLLKLSKELNKEEKHRRNECLYSLGKDHKNSGLFNTLKKIFFKDKYRRYNHKIKTNIPIAKIKLAPICHYKILLSELKDVDINSLREKDEEALKKHLFLHVKLYDRENNYVIKVFIENTNIFSRKNFSPGKEILNKACLFQTKIQVETPYLLPFNEYHNNRYKSYEDRMLDFLYRKKLSYGIGHNTSCTWESCENDLKNPQWISSTFLPQYNVKIQSTEISSIDKKKLEIKGFSEFNKDKETIILNLKKLSDAYLIWISSEEKDLKKLDLKKRALATINTKKCRNIQARIQKGIDLLETNSMAFLAFQLANTAIYLQMFQNQWHFSKKKDGYEAFERLDAPQYSYNDYATKDYPDSGKIPCWRPFQLAFILQCLPSFIEEDSKDRDMVDLLYFPTGGGKTEAYLALSAFLIFWRRLKYPKNYDGVNIIIRYTLRLLSAQQFERASKLVLACEFIRKNHPNHLNLGDKRITIGFWVGGSTIPNKIKGPNKNCAEKKLNNALDRLNKKLPTINPFQLSTCQWCNTKIIGREQKNSKPIIGHRIYKDRLKSYCLNEKCCFSEKNGGLPIVLVDEDIYDNPPTILFATVDKFAQLAWKAEATSLFNSEDQNGNKNRKPELIIQDELHLLNGPLGSLVGLFENVILSLCTTENQRPKIIASTATIKNVDNQIKGLYNRSVQVFPQDATTSDDSFFSKTLSDSKRRYVGILPTGKTQTMTSLRLNAALFFARLELWKNNKNKKQVDQFWTILSYFKSLKQIGRFANKINAELIPEVKQLHVRYLMNQSQYYNKISYYNHNLELTSRIANEKIKKNLDRLGIPFEGDLDNYNAVDIILATNMISVGLDVERLNIMLMNGMPPNTAEYIQASSRVARKNEGLVFTLFDPNNTRDLSYFEDFILFHKTFYKQVEPLSVTPFAENALDKMLFTLMVTYFRHKMGFAANNMASALNLKDNKQKLVDNLKQMFNNNSFADDEDKQVISSLIESLSEEWDYKIQGCPNLFYYGSKKSNSKVQNLLKPIQNSLNEDDRLVCMQSMRSVEPNVKIKINYGR